MVDVSITPLATGQVQLHIKRCALASNNITHAVFCDAMDYWGFSPTGEEGWGGIPVWGFACVMASQAEGIAVGEKFCRYHSMAATVALTPSRASTSSVVEGAPHRAALAAVYNQYLRCSADPSYTADS